MNIHPFLQQLLAGQAVEWKPLGEVCDFRNGFAFKSGLFKDIGLPIIRISNINGKEIDLNDLKYFDIVDYNINLSPYEIQKGDILIAMSGATTGKIGLFNKDSLAYLNQRVGKFIPNTKFLNNKFLYHVLLSKTDYLYTMAGGGAQPNLSSNKLMEQLVIPIPPLSVQTKIVQILDTMTAITAELTAELSMRNKQYQYYRDKLLSENELAKVGFEWKSLGEITLKTENIKWKETNLNYQYIDLTSVNIENKSIMNTVEINKETAPSRAQKIVLENDIIFATTRPTQMRIAVIPNEFNGDIVSSGYCVLRANEKQVLNKWIYFCLLTTSFKDYLEENQSGSAYPAISDGKLKEFRIPIPPLSEQVRIVAILDKFDTLTQSISDGLPREIELRQKQYEYYREMLLGFERE